MQIAGMTKTGNNKENAYDNIAELHAPLMG